MKMKLIQSPVLALLNLFLLWACLLIRTTANSTTQNDEASAGWSIIAAAANNNEHPNPNEENYPGMIYVGRSDDDGTRTGFHVDNGIKYIYGTGFDETHRDIEETDLHHEHFGPDSEHDIADRAHGKTHEQIMHEKRAANLDLSKGPKPFGWFEEHPLDGGMVPPKVVRVDPFFIDEAPVTNKEFGKFVRATYYETEAEKFGWSFVLSSFLPNADHLHEAEVDPQAEDWVAVDGAYWRAPEGPGTSYKYRENHPVVHVSHRDAAEYCTWVGKRLPGEREWEAAARGGHFGPKNRTLYVWGDEQTTDASKEYANLWGDGDFPWGNKAEDGWRATSPVKTFKPNAFEIYDMTGNVWEWQRGGKHKKRIVRGGSYVDSLDGSFNHAATLGARATLHGTTTTGNVGFRCVKAPKRKEEYHWVYENDAGGGDNVELVIEDGNGNRKQRRTTQHQQHPRSQYEDDDEFDEVVDHDPTKPRPDETRKRVLAVKPRTITSDEL
jgi:formylglycine-generating enzyme required for sulfatase activity